MKKTHRKNLISNRVKHNNRGEGVRKTVTTIIDIELYNEIKKHGFKLNYLISLGYHQLINNHQLARIRELENQLRELKHLRPVVKILQRQVENILIEKTKNT